MSITDKGYGSKEWKKYAEDVIENLAPNVKVAPVAVMVSEDQEFPDVRAATELGMILLMGKPLVLIREPGHHVHAGIERAADAIVDGEIQHPKTQQALEAAILLVTLQKSP